jgi:hypothetical protein
MVIDTRGRTAYTQRTDDLREISENFCDAKFSAQSCYRMLGEGS